MRDALHSNGGEHTPRRLVAAIAAGGFNSGGAKLGGRLGLYPWYGILALGLYPLRQHADTEASLRGLARVAVAGYDVLIFPQSIRLRGRLVAGIPVSITRGPLAIAFGPPLTWEAHESAETFTVRLQTECFALTRRAEDALGRRAVHV